MNLLFRRPPSQISKSNFPAFQFTFGLVRNPGWSGSEHDKSCFVFPIRSWVGLWRSRCLPGKLQWCLTLAEAAHAIPAVSFRFLWRWVFAHQAAVVAFRAGDWNEKPRRHFLTLLLMPKYLGMLHGSQQMFPNKFFFKKKKCSLHMEDNVFKRISLTL